MLYCWSVFALIDWIELKSEVQRPRLWSYFTLLISATNTYCLNRHILISEMCFQVSVENVTTFYIFRGLRVGSRGLDSKCQFQEEIIYNLFKVLMLVKIPMNMTYLWVKEILFEKFLTMMLFHLRIIHPFYLSLLLIAYRDCPSLWFTFSPKCSYFKDLRMRLQMRIGLILKLQRKKKCLRFCHNSKSIF